MWSRWLKCWTISPFLTLGESWVTISVELNVMTWGTFPSLLNCNWVNGRVVLWVTDTVGVEGTKVLWIVIMYFIIETFCRISDPDTDDDGAETQAKTNGSGTTNNAPSINVSGIMWCPVFDQTIQSTQCYFSSKCARG